MKGAIIGDIVGSVYEWHNHRSKDFELLGPTPYYPDGHFFTDDTVMTVAVGEALLKSKGMNESETVKLIGDTMRRYGREYPRRGYGEMFKKWIASDNMEAYNSFGNGAPTRCSAAGWLATSVEEAARLSVMTAAPTHNHPEGLKAAEVTARLIYFAGKGEHFWTMGELQDYARRYYDIPKLDDIRPTHRFSETSQDTMPVALAAFFESTDFVDAIRNAISVGGDSDTIAAITGSIAEAYYGVPDELWQRTRLHLTTRLDHTVRAFYEELNRRESERS